LATFPFLSSLDQVRFTSTDPASAALAALPVLGISHMCNMYTTTQYIYNDYQIIIEVAQQE